MPFDAEAFAGADAIVLSPFFNPAWSPDGSKLLWLAPTGERVYLQLFDLDEQTAVSLFNWDPARFGGLIPSPVWSPDGQWIAMEVLANGPEGSGLWLVAVDGSETYLVDA
jgi:Tol biopolymer transport system component